MQFDCSYRTSAGLKKIYVYTIQLFPTMSNNTPLIGLYI
jgi:hypothetical protein